MSAPSFRIHILFFFVMTCPEARDSPAPGSYVLFKGQKAGKTWGDASAACVAKGMRLATILDRNQAYQASRALAQGNVQKAWFGLRLIGGSTFRLVNGSIASYFLWASGEPSAKHNCVVLGSGKGISRAWRTARCGRLKPFLCQVPPAAGTTTTTTRSSDEATPLSCSGVQAGDVSYPRSFAISCGERDVGVSRKFALTYQMPLRPALARLTGSSRLPDSRLLHHWFVELEGQNLFFQREDVGSLDGGTTYTIEAVEGQDGVMDICGRRLAPFSCNFSTEGPITAHRRVVWMHSGLYEAGA